MLNDEEYSAFKCPNCGNVIQELVGNMKSTNEITCPSCVHRRLVRIRSKSVIAICGARRSVRREMSRTGYLSHFAAMAVIEAEISVIESPGGLLRFAPQPIL